MTNSNKPDFNPNKFRKRPRRPLPPNKKSPKPNNNWIFWVILGFLFIMMFSQSGPMTSLESQQKLSYSQFYAQVKNNAKTGDIKSIQLLEGPDRIIKGVYKDNSTFKLYIPSEDKDIIDLINNNVEDFEVVPAETFWTQLFFSFMPIVLIILFIWFISHKGSQVGNKIWSFGKSRPKVNSRTKDRITFKNVAGVDEAKEELQEIIEFLKDPKRFERLGGKIPKGVLLVGPPGTGKTLLAKAVAGEANVPFFSLSGSDFVEMFVGVGASRVRDLFDQGRKASMSSGKGAIIFIDEIDAVGRQRFAGIGGGNDEREQTLNALLVEMDGFNTHSGLILIAATNRPDTLDPALLRPGRFDRQIVVGLPDIDGREGILKVHSKSIKLGPDVDLRKIAQQTVYFSGADLANACNEAALLAARKNKEFVTQEEFYAAVERVTMGPEKKSRTISRREKEMTAYHESGHALLSLLIDEVDTFSKVSIIPRGMAGGYTITPPTEDRHYHNKKELLGKICVLLGGLVAEELYTSDTSTGVSNDLQKATHIARSMVCTYGMSEKLGTISFDNREHTRFLGRDLMEQKEYSEETAKLIDQEVHNIIKDSYERAKKLLTENRDKLDKMTKTLVERELIDIQEARALLGMNKAQESNDTKNSDISVPEDQPMISPEQEDQKFS